MSSEKKKKVLPWILVAAVFFVLIGLISLFRPSAEPEEQSYELTMIDLGFDTPVTFQSVCTEQDFVKYLDIVRKRFQTNNALFDRYETYDGIENVKSINGMPAGTAIELDPVLRECIEIALKANQLVEKFDITQGDLIELWHAFREEGAALPTQEMIEQAMNKAGITALQLDGNTLVETSKFSLDLGGIAKGFTVQQAIDELEEAGCTNGYINAGGNVALIGTKPDGEPWKIGIISPDTDRSLVRYTTDSPTSLVTSGDYQRYVEMDGVRYSHIIDPVSGQPARYFRSVTVINPDSAWADAMSTSLFLMDLEEGLEFCQNNSLEAVWICQKGEYTRPADLQSSGFDIYLTEGLKEKITIVE